MAKATQNADKSAKEKGEYLKNKKTTATKTGGVQTVELAKAFRRITVPAKAIVIVLEPGEVMNPQLVTYLRSQGFEITAVKEEPQDGRQPTIEEALEMILQQIFQFSPEVQNTIFKLLFAKLADERKKECEFANDVFTLADKRMSGATKNKNDLFYFFEEVAKSGSGNATLYAH